MLAMTRQFSFVLLASLVWCLGQGTSSAVEFSKTGKPGAYTQYTVQLEVQGDVRVGEGKKQTTLPLVVNGEVKFAERRVDDGSLAEEQRTIRHYDSAKATIRVDRDSNIIKLQQDHQLIRGRLSQSKLNLLSVKEPLTREERDLLDIPGDPLTLAALLPQGPAELNEKWTIPNKALAPLLCLDEIKRGECTAKIINEADGLAEITITGKIIGQVTGSATSIELTGHANVEIKTGTFLDWNFKIKESRDSGLATPGFDITATVTGTADSATEVATLTDKALEGIALVDDQQPNRLSYTQRRAKYRFQYDQRWRTVVDESQQLSMRLVDDGLIIAHCNLKLLELAQTAPPLSLAEFEQEIKTTLGDRFQKFQDKTEGKNPNGVRTLKIVAEGLVDTVPVLWLSYYFEGPDGTRATVTIALEDKLLDKYAEADRDILATFEFGRSENALEPDLTQPKR
jgi:hypothetical protein